MEAFTEVAAYSSDSDRIAHPSYAFTSSKHRVGPDNYYLNQMTYDGTAIFAGKELYIDNYRYTERPRLVNVKRKKLIDSYKALEVLQETGTGKLQLCLQWQNTEILLVIDLSNNLLKAALRDSTPAAYNHFSAGVNTNIERALVDVYRKNESSLDMFDFKMSNPSVASLPAGDVGMLVGFEYREEEIIDDRDPRLDGTITYTDYEGDTYPLVSDVVNSSPTGDLEGSRDITSLFTEFQIPLSR